MGLLTWLWLRLDDEGNKSSRALGLVVARGTLLVLISPVDGSEVIENPFAQQEDTAEMTI
jgi:U6 snRNA-associated Sm-like protein LSm7